MVLVELENLIVDKMTRCLRADREGRPGEMRAHLGEIQKGISEFLGESDAVNEDSKETEEKKPLLGPDQQAALDAEGS